MPIYVKRCSILPEGRLNKRELKPGETVQDARMSGDQMLRWSLTGTTEADTATAEHEMPYRIGDHGEIISSEPTVTRWTARREDINNFGPGDGPKKWWYKESPQRRV